jgi:glutathione S-transferase
MIKIWGRNTSVNVQKVMWAVGELKLAHQRIDVGGAFGKNHEPAYLAMNPNGLVPTLEEDDFILWESNTIVRYQSMVPGRSSPRICARALAPRAGWTGSSRSRHRQSMACSGVSCARRRKSAIPPQSKHRAKRP